MTLLAPAAAVVVGGACAAAVAVLERRRRVAARVAPYRPNAPVATAPGDGAVWSTAARGAATAWWHAIRARGARGTAAAARLEADLRAAGLDPDAADAFRVRRTVQTTSMAAAGLAVGALILHSPLMTLVLAGTGAAVGVTRAPARLARLAEERRTRMRLELVTVDQLLAMHVRAGAGPVQAVTRVVERGHGCVVDELRAVLASIRAGRSEAEAFRHAATTTAEPHAARTYRLFALAAEHGADLGAALRALSDDLRQVRREDLRRQATRRRAAMLVPTIAVLAPIMLLFVIAPLPSIVLGGR